jgi:hypothetical protein
MKRAIDITLVIIFVSFIALAVLMYCRDDAAEQASHVTTQRPAYTITKIDVEGCSYNLITTKTNTHLIHSKNCACIKEKQKRLVEFVKKNYVKEQKMMNK